ncbi:arsenate reductase (glutaredoxin) [Leeuwenhoekiella aestuarii]|uniref:Arsenate reductase n=1 Tax=Leeuwenhoekiella aestuarii TaxID=2249426 RepID=A0A4Q0NVG5_9FLAO|nr:arsenate reductase (glutaredoxin) [Leeuwenhoekiella aestuarii]RXG15266.1 arsenate reductase [Leeuwenhoekiella aestuarii]
MLKIYHNPRCSKSREGLALLEESGKEFDIVKYLDTPPSYIELAAIIGKLKIAPIELVRKNEAIWKEQFKGKNMSDEELIQAMVENPKLIERPIVILDNEAVVGRPPENIKKLLS